MKKLFKAAVSTGTLLALSFVLLPASLAGAASNAVLYNSTISPLSRLGNLPSVGAEAYAFNEFGNQITFAPGTARILSQVTVTMSSWGCQSGSWTNDTCATTHGAAFSEPITFNIYNAPDPATPTIPGSLIASATQTFSIPYRPSADLRCVAQGATGEWYDPSVKQCFNGLATNITFNFNALTMPDNVVFGIAYNTTHYGYAPIGQSASCYTSSGGCGYDSLNIALAQDPTDVTAGSDPNSGTVFQYSPYASQYCDKDPAGINVFRLDSPTNACWYASPSGSGVPGDPAYVPAVQFKH